MTPLAALQTATINPARYFGREQTAGSVASGRSADLVLLDENPLADTASVRRIRGVIVAGRLLDREALDTALARVNERRHRNEKGSSPPSFMGVDASIGRRSGVGTGRDHGIVSPHFQS